jgi:hypothetical protein
MAVEGGHAENFLPLQTTKMGLPEKFSDSEFRAFLEMYISEIKTFVGN